MTPDPEVKSLTSTSEVFENQVLSSGGQTLFVEVFTHGQCGCVAALKPFPG